MVIIRITMNYDYSIIYNYDYKKSYCLCIKYSIYYNNNPDNND